jgi:gluconolactonase
LWVISPEGKHLGTIVTPRHAHNFAWGDADGKTLYLCARAGLYRIRLNIEGVRPVVPNTSTMAGSIMSCAACAFLAL